MKALIVVDMLNDLVNGAGARPQVALIVPAIRRLIDHAQVDPEWLTIYANDAHRADDREVEIRGRHAMAGTLGAAVIDALAPVGAEREFVVPKRFYGAFDGTELEDICLDYEVSDVVLAGQETDCAIRHTAYGAFLAEFDIVVPVDAVCGRPGADQEKALADLESLYGASLTTSAALIGRPMLRTAASNPAIRGPAK